MKTHLLAAVFLAVTAFVFNVNHANAQCTPDPQYTTPGYYPEGQLPAAMIDFYYETTLTLVVPTDTVIEILGQQTTVPIDSIVADDINGIPTGLSWVCNPPSCGFAGGSTGCIQLSGIVTDEMFIGANPLEVEVTVANGLFPVQVDVDNFELEVVANTSVSTLANTEYSVAQNQPNPFSDFTQIVFTTKQSQPYNLTVTNMLGMQVHQQNGVANPGENTLRFEGDEYPEGFYFYTLTSGGKATTKRMILAR